MILQNDIMGILLTEVNLNMASLNKIAFLNKEHADYIEEYFKNIYLNRISPSINFTEHITRYYTCNRCFKLTIKPDYRYDIGLCENCIHNVDMCEACGSYRDLQYLTYLRCNDEYQCKDECIFNCEKCAKVFNSIDDVECISGYMFMCYPCYVQESAISRYEKRKTS